MFGDEAVVVSGGENVLAELGDDTVVVSGGDDVLVVFSDDAVVVSGFEDVLAVLEDGFVVVSGNKDVSAVLEDVVAVLSSRGDDFSVLVDDIVVVSSEEDDFALLVTFFVGDGDALPRGCIVVTSFIMYDVVVLPGVFEIAFVGDFVRNIVHFVDFKVDSDRPPDTVGVGMNPPDGLVIAFVSGGDEVLAVRNKRKQNIQ